MAKNPWSLSDETRKKIAELSSDLNSEINELREAFEEKSEKWQDGDKGLDVGAWLEELDNLAQALDDVQEEV